MDPSHSAGDVGRYTYCALNWHLSRQGVTGSGGRAGVLLHQQLAEQVDALELYQSQARFSLETAVYAALFAISTATLAVEFFWLKQAQASWWVLLVLSVTLAASSLYMFVFHRYFSSRAKNVVRSSRIAGGEVRFSDSPRHPEQLQSRILPLKGRPDYIVERDGVWIPVEMKTGKSPAKPYDSHVLQLAAYCYLVGEKKGVRPPFGIISYPEREFEVPYTDQLENRLVNNLLRMETHARLGDTVHRDHENPGRCIGCSRRDACTERLA